MNLILALLLEAQSPSTQELIDQLRSEKPDVRNEAEKELRKRAKTILPELEKAVKDKDPQVARRIQEILGQSQMDPGLEALKKIEESIGKAKTLRVAFMWQGEGAADDPAAAKGSGMVLLKEGDRFRIELTMTFVGEHRGTFISNGGRATATLDGNPAIVWNPPATVRKLLAIGLLRGGFILSFTQPPYLNETNFMTVDAARLGEDDGPNKTLFFTIHFQGKTGGPETGEVKLWYDPKTGTPRKRTVTIHRTGDQKTTMTEMYSEFVLNDEIPDGKFVLPGAAGLPKMFQASDIVEPEPFRLLSSDGAKVAGGILESGTLEYEGSGSLVEQYKTYKRSMKEQGWVEEKEDIEDAKISWTLKKDSRTCKVEFSKTGDTLRVVITVSTAK